MSNIIDFVDTVFSSIPGEENSLKLEIETDDISSLFEALSLILTQGMKLHFGDKNNKVDISKLDDHDIQYMNEYFYSFGYQFIITNNLGTINSSDPLSELYLNLKVDNKVYYIRFSKYDSNIQGFTKLQCLN